MKLALPLLFCALLCGCVATKIKVGETEVRSIRFVWQGKMDVEFNLPDGTKLFLRGYRSDAESLVEAATRGAMQGMKP